jgi:hypothetical protein
VPDFDGRGRPRPTAAESALWVPRVILSPLYFVNEFLLRRPLSVVVPAAEKIELPRKIYDFFLFAPGHKGGIVPVGLVEFNLNPSVGVYAFWNDGPFQGNDMSLHAELWSSQWLAGSVTERLRFSARRSLQFKVRGIRRPDIMFFGIGPSALEHHQSRYGVDRVDATATFGEVLWRQSRIDTTLGVRDVRTYDGHFGSDPSLTSESARGAFPLPPGFGRDVSEAFGRVVLVYDDRRPWPASGSGIRLEAQAEQGNVWSPSPSGWVRYGATLGGFYDLNGYRRVLSVSTAISFVDPLGHGEVPFTELVSLGGDGPMRGLYPGRLLDRSAAVATVRYVWPVAPWLDASLQLAAGNVFGTHLDRFRASLVRLSGALGLVLDAWPDAPVELLVGVGTETIEDRLKLNTLRAAFGVNHF